MNFVNLWKHRFQVKLKIDKKASLQMLFCRRVAGKTGDFY